jgi:hypothetical protein
MGRCFPIYYVERWESTIVIITPSGQQNRYLTRYLTYEQIYCKFYCTNSNIRNVVKMTLQTHKNTTYSSLRMWTWVFIFAFCTTITDIQLEYVTKCNSYNRWFLKSLSDTHRKNYFIRASSFYSFNLVNNLLKSITFRWLNGHEIRARI